MATNPCIAVVSPFLDKRHGTERYMAEQVERLARLHGYEVHLYCQRVEDIEGLEEFRRGQGPSDGRGDSPGRIVWHRVSAIPGPHLLKYVWWLLANQYRRRRDQRRGFRYDLVYSPGINCWDADVIIIHIVFHQLQRLLGEELRLWGIPLLSWPRVIHRKLYYRLIMALEKQIYPSPRVTLAAVSQLTAREVQRHFGRPDVHVISNGVDTGTFNPEIRQRRRAESRRWLGFVDADFVLLLVGNDWKTKGLVCLLAAVAACPELPFKVLVVGRDDRGLYRPTLVRLRLSERVQFANPSPDVMQFYAAADVYVGPSLHDSFALPPQEAMACGLPVIVSERAGVSELIHDGADGFILRDPRDSATLAGLLRRLFTDPDLCSRLGETAARTARRYSWERNAEQGRMLLEEALSNKNSTEAR